MLPLHVPRSMPRHVLRYYYGLYIRAAAGRSGRDRLSRCHLTFSYLNVRSGPSLVGPSQRACRAVYNAFI